MSLVTCQYAFMKTVVFFLIGLMLSHVARLTTKTIAPRTSCAAGPTAWGKTNARIAVANFFYTFMIFVILDIKNPFA